MTYSIVARDARTGQMGVAVQSHYFSVGSTVTWARAGIGAVATQAIAEPSYGPLGLELMAAGRSAAEALGALLASDRMADVRQVAMVDARGRAAAHTGTRCIPHAGHALGRGVSCQGNIMRNGRVWKAMLRDFQGNGRLPLPERLVSALEAAEAEGGDARGRQSAAIVVVAGEQAPAAWGGRVVELRVEDHPEPVAELKRLLRYRRAYDLVDRGDDELASGNRAAALRSYERAMRLVPEVEEIRYWVGISLLPTRSRPRGLSLLRKVFAADPGYIRLTKDIMKKGSIPIDPSVRTAFR